MEKLIIVKRYDEDSNTYVYSINYSREYFVPSGAEYEGIEKYIANSLVLLTLQDFESLDLDNDIEIVDFTVWSEIDV